MHISNPRYRLAELTRQRLPAAATLLTDTFLHHNPIWTGYRPAHHEVFNFMLQKTTEMLDAQDALIHQGVLQTFINFVYLDQQDSVIGVSTNYDLADYLTANRPSVSLDHFNLLEKMGLELEKSILREDIVLGKSLYGMFVSVSQEHMSGGTAVSLFLDVSDYMFRHGVSTIYGRCSNMRTEALMVKLGGKRTGIVEVDDNGQKYMLSFARMPFLPLDQMMRKVRKQQPQPKL